MNSFRNEPKSKSIETVNELLTLMERPTAPLPESIRIRDAVLVLSAKKDAYYTVTSKACSCPSFAFHSRPCKHQRKYFKDSCARNEVPKTECASDSIKPVLIWPSGHSGF